MSDAKIEARHYRVDGDALRCELCPWMCVIREGKQGVCRTRTNEGGKLILTNYGRVTSVSIDPIEKKPLYHFHPATGILSVGGMGCNFTCGFCQNWNISQKEVPTQRIFPEELAAIASEHVSESIGVAFTYNEPMIWFEYIMDSAPLLRRLGQKVVLVTNGYINPAPLDELLPNIDAMNIDLKSFTNDFYKTYCSGRLAPVKHTIESAVKAGVWVELTCLMIPGLNDSEAEIESMAGWIASLSSDIPLHLSRYFPNYNMHEPPTPSETLRRAQAIAKKKLHYVYLGNVADPESGVTRCPKCDTVVIERKGYSTKLMPALTADNLCASCGGEIAVRR